MGKFILMLATVVSLTGFGDSVFQTSARNYSRAHRVNLQWLSQNAPLDGTYDLRCVSSTDESFLKGAVLDYMLETDPLLGLEGNLGLRLSDGSFGPRQMSMSSTGDLVTTAPEGTVTLRAFQGSDKHNYLILLLEQPGSTPINATEPVKVQTYCWTLHSVS